METMASITVRNLRPLQSKTVYALVDADIEIGGVVISIVGVQARHLAKGGTSVHLPTFRDADGKWRAAVVLPDEIREALCDAVLEFMVEEGIAQHAGSGQTDAEADTPESRRVAQQDASPDGVDLGVKGRSPLERRPLQLERSTFCEAL